jgi:hypothetical protein
MPVKVSAKFATVYDTARTLGVSPKRVKSLIKLLDAANGAQVAMPRAKARTASLNGATKAKVVRFKKRRRN